MFQGGANAPPLKETLHALVQCTCKCMDSITFQSCNYCESINCSLFVVNWLTNLHPSHVIYTIQIKQLAVDIQSKHFTSVKEDTRKIASELQSILEAIENACLAHESDMVSTNVVWWVPYVIWWVPYVGFHTRFCFREGKESIIWGTLVAGGSGGYFLCTSNFNPLLHYCVMV